MSRILVRSIANIGKLVKNVRNVPLNSNTLTSCNVKCLPSMMQSFGRSYASKAEQSLAKYLGKVYSWSDREWMSGVNYIDKFDVQKLDGKNVELFRKFNMEKVTIKFNIDGFLKKREIPNCEYDPEWDDENPFVDVIQPSFTVEINKGKEKNLFFKLGFKGSYEDKMDEHYYPEFDILSVSIAKNGEVDNTIYSNFGENMDENVRLYLETMLKERGVDHNFLSELQDWAYEYDKKLDLDLLEDLNKHVT